MDPPSGLPPPPPPPGPPPRSVSSGSAHRRKSSSPITALLSERSSSPYASGPSVPPPPPSSKSRQYHISGRPPSPSWRSPPGLAMDDAASLNFSNHRQTAASRIVEERRRAAQAMLESTELVEDALAKEDVFRRVTIAQAPSLPSQPQVGDRENEPPNAYTWDVATVHSKSSDGQTTSTRGTRHQKIRTAPQQPREGSVSEQSESRGSSSRERRRPEPSPGRSESRERNVKSQGASYERRQPNEPPVPTQPSAKPKKGKPEEAEKKKGGGLFGIFGRGRDKSGTPKESKSGTPKDSRDKPTKGHLPNQHLNNSQPSPSRKPTPSPVQPVSKAHTPPHSDSSRSQLSPPAKLVVSTSATQSSVSNAKYSGPKKSPIAPLLSPSKTPVKAPPKNIKPGQSYKSSPNSAEIVVRTSLIQTPSRPEPPVSGRILRSPLNNGTPRERMSRTPTQFSFTGRQDPDGTKDPPISQSFSLGEDPPESPSTVGIAPSASMDSYAHAQLEAPPSFSMDIVPFKKGRDPSLASMADDYTMRDNESGLLVSVTSESQEGSNGVVVHRLGRLVSDTTFSDSKQSSHETSLKSKHADFSLPSPVASLRSKYDVRDEILAERAMQEPPDSLDQDDDDFMELPAPPSNIGTLSFDSNLQQSHMSLNDDFSAMRAVSMLDPSDSTSTTSTSPRSAPRQEEQPQRRSPRLGLDPAESSSRFVATVKTPETTQQHHYISSPPVVTSDAPLSPSEFQVEAVTSWLQKAADTLPEPITTEAHFHAFAEIVVTQDEVSAITDPSYRKRDKNSAGALGTADHEDADTSGHTHENDQTVAASDNPVVAASDEVDILKEILVSDSPSNKSIDPFAEPFFQVPESSPAEARKPDPLELYEADIQTLEIALTRSDTDRGSTITGAVAPSSDRIESGYISAASTEEEEKKVDDELRFHQKLAGLKAESIPTNSIYVHRSTKQSQTLPQIETALSYSTAGVSVEEQFQPEINVNSSQRLVPPSPSSVTPKGTFLVHLANPSPTAATVVDHRVLFASREKVSRMSSLPLGTSSSRPIPPSPEAAASSSVLQARQYFLGLERNIKKEETVGVVAHVRPASIYSRTTLKVASQSMSPRQRRRAKASSPIRRISLDPNDLTSKSAEGGEVSELHEEFKHPTPISCSPKQHALQNVIESKQKRRPVFASFTKHRIDHNPAISQPEQPSLNGLLNYSDDNIQSGEGQILMPKSTATTSYLAKLKGGRRARSRVVKSEMDEGQVVQVENTSELERKKSNHVDKIPMRNRLGLLEEAKKNPGAVRSKKSHKEKSKDVSGVETPIRLKPRDRDIDVIAKGFSIKSSRRKKAIAEGKATPVIIIPKQPVGSIDVQASSPSIDRLIKDPIQRAGFRLLSKAAIPIQATVRRYLAQRESVDRMWALIEIQSYFRRWKCEAFKLAHTYSATRIQSLFRGWRDRDTLEDHHFCATQIQKCIRGYFVFTFVREILQRIPLAQAQIRGFLAKRIAAERMYAIILIQAVVRSHLCRVYVTRMRAATVLQRIARGILAREEATQRRAAATVIQASWRSFSTRLMFQLDFVDIITVQSIVRRWLACRRKYELDKENRNAAAKKIQAAWRGFHDYTMYIFAMADIIVVQRALRMWQAKMKVKELQLQKEAQILNSQRNECATTVQAYWRRYTAQSFFVSQLVNIIVIQSMARRYLARKKRCRAANWKHERMQNATMVQRCRRMTLFRRSLEVHRAARKIQTLWRGFWQYTHYIIVQYEIVRLQALVRGNLARNYFGMRLGCAIIIQATGRQYLARKRVRSIRLSEVLLRGAAVSMRESNACKKIQSLWKILLRSRVEKAAGLVIERFFLMVKEEVDREIRRREKKRTSKSKREKRRRHKKEPEDKMLERAWLNTVDENKVDEFSYPLNSESRSFGAESRSKSAPRLRNSFSTESGVSFHPSVVSTEKDTSIPKKHVTLLEEASALANERSLDDSDVSGLTFRSDRLSYKSRQTALTQKELSDDLSLEEAYLDVQAHQTKQKRKTVDDYIQKYGLQKSMTLKSQASAHTRVSIESRVTSMSRASAASRRFFPEEIETPRSTHPGDGSLIEAVEPYSAGSARNSALGMTSTQNSHRFGPKLASRVDMATERDDDKYSSLLPSSSSVSSSDAGFNAYDDEHPHPSTKTESVNLASSRYFARSSVGRQNNELNSNSSSPREGASFYHIESA